MGKAEKEVGMILMQQLIEWKEWKENKKVKGREE